MAYSLTTDHPGLNRVALDLLTFDSEGVTTIKIIIAIGRQ